MLTVIFSLFLGTLAGFTGSILRLPSQTKEAMARALEVVEKTYSGVIKDLQSDVAYLKKRVEESDRKKCENMGCKNRIPPLNNNSYETNTTGIDSHREV